MDRVKLIKGTVNRGFINMYSGRLFSIGERIERVTLPRW
jgi:hypothetical protein